MPSLTIHYVPRDQCVVSLTVGEDIAAAVFHHLEPCATRDPQGNITVRFRAEHAVPDVVRFVVTKDTVREPFGRLGVSTSQYIGDLSGCVLMLLESPHRDEYGGLLHPLAPAVGSTGDNIRRHKDLLRTQILNKLSGLKRRISRPFLLVNTVPLPASCLLEPLDKNLRDQVSRKLMSQLEIKRSLLAKLRWYAPAVVINAATSQLHADIDSIVAEYSKGKIVQTHKFKADTTDGFVAVQTTSAHAAVHIVNLPHPQSWRIKK